MGGQQGFPLANARRTTSIAENGHLLRHGNRDQGMAADGGPLIMPSEAEDQRCGWLLTRTTFTESGEFARQQACRGGLQLYRCADQQTDSAELQLFSGPSHRSNVLFHRGGETTGAIYQSRCS